MRRFLSTITLISFLLLGCATAQNMNRVRVGMTKADVIAAMGTPVSVSAQEGTEYLNFKLSETGDDAFRGWTTPYFVRIVNGRVDAFGRHGDFDSTKTPTIRIEKDEIIKQDTNIKLEEKPDSYMDLVKLKDLKDQGIITDEEFVSKKKEILKKYYSHSSSNTTSDSKKPMASLTIDKKTVPVALMINQDNIHKDKIELSERWEKAGTTLNGLQLFIDNNTKSKPSEDIVRVWVKTIANTDN